MVDQRPGAARIGAFGHDAQARAEVLTAQGAVAEVFLQAGLQVVRLEFGAQPPQQPAPLVENQPAEVEVHFPDFRCRLAHREHRGDDGPRAGAADEVEVMAEAKIGIVAVALAEDFFDFFEKSNGHRAAYAAAVERQHALGAGAGEVSLEGEGHFFGGLRV